MTALHPIIHFVCGRATAPLAAVAASCLLVFAAAGSSATAADTSRLAGAEGAESTVQASPAGQFENGQPPRSASSAGKPDLVVVLVDDLGAIDERIIERLPNLKALFVNGGLRFDQAFSETPLCCPGRASFLTGQHTKRHGVWINLASLLDPSRTLPTALQDAGYETYLIGKYLNKPDSLVDKTPPGWSHADIRRVVSEDTDGDSGTVDFWLDGQLTSIAGYKDRIVADRALTHLRASSADKPLFFWLAPTAPHRDGSLSGWRPQVEPQYQGDPRCAGITPWKPPSSTRKGGMQLDEICRSMLTIDDMVGALRVEFSAQGRDPVWLFTSDNGMGYGAHGKAGKMFPWSDRLPLWMAGPGIAVGHTDALVSNIDFGPTLAQLAGTTMPAADGVSFASVLDGEGDARTWTYEVSDHVLRPSLRWDGVRTPEWRLLYYRGTWRLYDLARDPWEMTDVAAANPSTVLELESLVMSLR
jgi:arylsulfatase A-like enzyme